jgi:hypothetical protein
MNNFKFKYYFDDVSEFYADSIKLDTTPNGAMAV